jgi:hypothetical protein
MSPLPKMTPYSVNKSAKVVLGRALINAQIAAGYALTLRLRHGLRIFTPTLTVVQKMALAIIVDQAHNLN